jgi:hypothetical protein
VGLRPLEHTKTVQLCEDVLDKTVTIAKGLPEEEERRLLQCLKNNQDVFTWSKNDLKGGA